MSTTQIEGKQYPARPTIFDPHVEKSAWESIAPRLAEWMGTTETQAVDRALRQRVTFSLNEDAYEIAKGLEKGGWDTDRDLLDILEGMDTWSAVRRAEEAWIEQNNISSSCRLHQLVEIHRFSAKCGRVIGEITDIHPKTGKVDVFLPQRGFVRKGSGTHSTLINIEDITCIPLSCFDHLEAPVMNGERRYQLRPRDFILVKPPGFPPRLEIVKTVRNAQVYFAQMRDDAYSKSLYTFVIDHAHEQHCTLLARPILEGDAFEQLENGSWSDVDCSLYSDRKLEELRAANGFTTRLKDASTRGDFHIAQQLSVE